MKKIHKIIGVASVIFAPALVLAQGGTSLVDIMAQIRSLIQILIPLLIAIAVVLFIWGVVQFIGSAGNEESRAIGRQLMIWGIIGLFVIVVLWGLVNALIETFNLDVSVPLSPGVPSLGS